jgi:hypothetical protein
MFFWGMTEFYHVVAMVGIPTNFIFWTENDNYLREYYRVNGYPLTALPLSKSRVPGRSRASRDFNRSERVAYVLVVRWGHEKGLYQAGPQGTDHPAPCLYVDRHEKETWRLNARRLRPGGCDNLHSFRCFHFVRRDCGAGDKPASSKRRGRLVWLSPKRSLLRRGLIERPACLGHPRFWFGHDHYDLSARRTGPLAEMGTVVALWPSLTGKDACVRKVCSAEHGNSGLEQCVCGDCGRRTGREVEQLFRVASIRSGLLPHTNSRMVLTTTRTIFGSARPSSAVQKAIAWVVIPFSCCRGPRKYILAAHARNSRSRRAPLRRLSVIVLEKMPSGNHCELGGIVHQTVGFRLFRSDRHDSRQPTTFRVAKAAGGFGRCSQDRRIPSELRPFVSSLAVEMDCWVAQI